MSSTSSVVSVDSLSASSEPGCEQSHSASATNTAEPSSGNIGQACPASTIFTPLTQTDWVGSDESILSAADSRANPSPSPESRKAKRTTATSGRRCAASLHSRDPLGSLAKMLLGSSRWSSTMCSLTWRVSATPRGRLLFRLQLSELPTDAIGSGSLLPTPTAQTYGSNRGGAMGRTGKVRYSLETMARRGMLPTPTSRDWRSGKASEATHARNSRPLNEVVMRMWATPTVKGDYNRAGLSATSGDGLATQVGGALNPTWVEWLMGFPAEWTALDASEMPSSRKSSKKSVEPSCSANS